MAVPALGTRSTGTPLFDALVPIVRPELGGAVEAACAEAFPAILASGQLTNGPYVRRFEELAAQRVGVRECVAVANCTSGLMLVLRCLDLQGEVILPSFTFFATGHAVIWNGLDPVLVDCEPETLNIDPDAVREAISPRTCAIIGVHIWGNPAAVTALEQIADEHGLALIFDSAHGFGASVGGRPVGSFGDAEVFSLSPTKLLVAGEGGLITTDDAELARRLRIARNYGDGGTYDCEVMGLNARMTEFQAVLGAAGLEDLDDRAALREQTATVYVERLRGQPGISFQIVRPGNVSSRKDFGILIDESEAGAERDYVCAALERDNVQTRRYFDPPLHRQKLYRDCQRAGSLINSERASRRVLNPPVYTRLGTERAAMIANRIVEIVEDVRSRGYPDWWRGTERSRLPHQ